MAQKAIDAAAGPVGLPTIIADPTEKKSWLYLHGTSRPPICFELFQAVLYYRQPVFLFRDMVIEKILIVRKPNCKRAI